jgi:DNA-binding transcriptional LysR family regulator
MTNDSVDLQALRVFVAVAREGSVSRAAAKLNRSQPAVSLQLKSMASATGLTLFHRTSHGVSLTSDGAALLPQAQRALAAVEDFVLSASRMHGVVRGELRIGTILEPAFIRLGALLRELVEIAPQIGTELRHGMSGSVLSQLQSGSLDVCFFLSPSVAETLAIDANLAVRTLNRFNYRVVAPAGWNAQVIGRGWESLATLPWLGTPPESVHHRLLARVFEPLGLSPRRVALVDQEMSMLDLIKSGVGLSLVRESIALTERHTHGLAVADQVQIPCELQFVCLATRRDEPVVASAWAALEQTWP